MTNCPEAIRLLPARLLSRRRLLTVAKGGAAVISGCGRGAGSDAEPSRTDGVPAEPLDATSHSNHEPPYCADGCVAARCRGRSGFADELSAARGFGPVGVGVRVGTAEDGCIVVVVSAG